MRYRTLVLAGVLALVAGGGAEAQIPLPFFKKKKKETPPAETAAPAKPPAEGAAPSAPSDTGQKPTAAQQQAQPAITAPAPGAPPAGQAGAAAARSPEEQKALLDAVAQAQAADIAPDTSVGHIKERIQRWRQVQLIDPQNVVAAGALQQGLDDLKQANERALKAGTATDQAKGEINAKLDAARNAILSKSWLSAEQNAGAVLTADPNNAVAQGLLAEARAGKRVDDIKRQAMFIVPILIVLAAGLVIVVKWGAKYREDRQKRADDLAAKRAAVLQIVDGVGRGRLVTIDKEKPIFKIGAAMGSDDSEKNDLVISDSGQQVSRFHCTLIRKGGDYFLVDASLNGTFLNGDAVHRGEHVLVEDGDEITLAEVARLKFLHT
jgi:hypothetical protein